MAQTIKLKRSSTSGAEPSTSDLELGEVAINTYDGKMFIKKNDGSDSIVELGTGGGGEASYIKTTVTATAGQTTVTGLTYTAGIVDVYLNGARLVVGQDVTATNGTSIVLAAGANLNDIIQVVAFKASEAFTPASPTFTGTVTAPTINASTSLKIAGVAITSTASELNLLDGVSTTAAELNILDGATVTAAELNKLDGVTATTAELNLTAGLTATTLELNKLDGATCSTVELNTLTGLTSTAAELNILDGVTATTLELNKLDGVTATTAELNYVDGVTSNIQTQIDAAVPGVHTIPFTANGAIAANKPVILQTDGKVAEVAIADRTRTTPSPSYVSDFDWDVGDDSRHHHAAAWETNGNRFVVAYEGGIRVGTVTGTGSATTVLMGNETVKAREDGQGYYTVDIIADPNNSGKFLIAYAYSYEHYYRTLTIIGEGAGAKVDLGRKSTLPNSPKISSSHTTYTSSHAMAWDKTSGKAVAVYHAEYDTNEKMVCTVINVNGTVTTNEDSVVVCENPSIEYRRVPCIAVDPNTSGLFVIAWRQSGSGTWAHKGVMRALKVTGTTLTTPGTTTPIPNSDLRTGTQEGAFSGPNIVFDPTTARQLVVLESGDTNTRSWIANVPDASGAFTGSITFQSNTPLSITSSERTSIPSITPMGQTASGEAGKYLISYYTLGTSGSPTGTWYHQEGSLSGTTMTWATREDTGHGCDISYGSGYPQYGPNGKLCRDPTYAGRAVSMVYDNEGSNTSHHVMVVEVGGVYNTTNLAGNFIGVAGSAISNAASGNVAIKGGVATLSSLTADSTYYVQGNGAIDTTASTGTEIGKAVTTTKLLLKGL